MIDHTKHFYSNIILNWLGLDYKTYSTFEIKKVLINKFGTDKSTTIKLDDEGKQILNCGNTIKVNSAVLYISMKYILKNPKPNCLYFEYEQQPIKVQNLL